MQWIANPQNRRFESYPLLQIMEVWQSPVYCTCLENRRSEMVREFESHRFRQLGLKVFMDAHKPVTLEEGDRYPLGPPT